MHIYTVSPVPLTPHQTAVLSVMYLTAVGFVMVLNGIFINDSDTPISANLFFAGGFLTTIFWVKMCINM